MAPKTALLLRFGGGVEFLDELRGILVEILQAGFTAKLHLAPLEFVDERLAHGSELFTRDHAGREGVGLGRSRGVSSLSGMPAKGTKCQSCGNNRK